MNQELSYLVERMNDEVFSNTSVIPWGSPVPSFGDLSTSKIATLGLNPSNREFVDIDGNELNGTTRRFHTLKSLGISDWSEINNKHLDLILDSCKDYFSRNPYDGWFKKLDYIISGTSMSYYFPSSQACHLDLIPYATDCKWTDLTNEQKGLLLELTGDTLGLLLKNSLVEILILNGKTVIENLQKIADVQFNITEMKSWTLPRRTNPGVIGYGYKGKVTNIGGIGLDREVVVLGFNHNIQSSYGVTAKVQNEIRNWVSENVKETIG